MENDEVFDKRWFAWERKYDPQASFVAFVYENGDTFLDRWNEDLFDELLEPSVRLFQSWMSERYSMWRGGIALWL